MRKEQIHKISRAVMWGSVGLAMIDVNVMLPIYPLLGITLFGITILLAIISGIFKKLYCTPLCKTPSTRNTKQNG